VKNYILLTVSILTLLVGQIKPMESKKLTEETKNNIVVFETNLGEIQINLNFEKAPITSKNFIAYVEEGFYDQTIFHRVIKNFMIQGGGFTSKMKQKKTNDEIENEAKNGLKNKKYSVAMARTSAPHSASSQFFINTKDNAFLDYPGQDGWGYCVFGEVLKGHGVVDDIDEVITSTKAGHRDVPTVPVIIQKAYIK
jgi:peptidyl-prolyl cis-trans isomerase B (cyclophilin B)